MKRFLLRFLPLKLALSLALCAHFALAAEIPDGGIPLPGQLSYTGAGLSVGLSFGMTDPVASEQDDYLFAWNGALEYFYGEHFSGGFSIWIYGGDMDSDHLIIYNRYRLHGRFHFMLFKNFSVFAAPLFWFENTDIEQIHEDINDGEEYTGDSLYVRDDDDPPDQSGISAGLEVGFGWRLPYNFGLFAETVYEHSFSTSPLISYSAGFGYDIRAISKFLYENFWGAWVTLEFSRRRYLDDSWTHWGTHFLLGLNVVF